MLCEVDETCMPLVRCLVPTHNFVLMQDEVMYDVIFCTLAGTYVLTKYIVLHIGHALSYVFRTCCL